MSSPPPAPHPFLHHDILPLILSYCTDRTLAHLMIVSRHILSEIVSLKWPIIVLEPSNRHPPIHSRTSLPDNPRWFSSAMVGLLAQYARIVRITPHAFYLCPPKMIWGDKGSMARTLIIDRKGLCRSDAIKLGVGKRAISEMKENNVSTSNLSECQISQLFTPTTLRIDGINHHPILSNPTGLRLSPSLVRLVLNVTPGSVPASFGPLEVGWLHTKIPDHIVDIAFVFRIPISSGNDSARNHLFALSIPHLSHDISRWITEATEEGRKGRKLTIVGAEELDVVTILPKRVKGQPKETIQAMIRQEVEREVGASGISIEVMDRVKFMTLADYVQNTPTRSELSLEEIHEIQDNIARRARERRQARWAQLSGKTGKIAGKSGVVGTS